MDRCAANSKEMTDANPDYYIQKKFPVTVDGESKTFHDKSDLSNISLQIYAY